MVDITDEGDREIKPILPDKLVELEQRVENLFREIEQLARERQVEELIGKFTELRQIMTEYGSDGSDLVKKKMKHWNQRLSAFGEVQLSIQLQIYINEGNQHLRAMAEAIKRDEYNLALERFEQIKELKDQMYHARPLLEVDQRDHIRHSGGEFRRRRPVDHGEAVHPAPARRLDPRMVRRPAGRAEVARVEAHGATAGAALQQQLAVPRALPISGAIGVGRRNG